MTKIPNLVALTKKEINNNIIKFSFCFVISFVVTILPYLLGLAGIVVNNLFWASFVEWFSLFGVFFFTWNTANLIEMLIKSNYKKISGNKLIYFTKIIKDCPELKPLVDSVKKENRSPLEIELRMIIDYKLKKDKENNKQKAEWEWDNV